MVVIYNESVQVQLKIIDERIEKMYQEYENMKVKPDEAMRIKKDLYEQTKAFVDEKIRLITNSCPKYVVEKRIDLTNKDKETLKTLIDIRNKCKSVSDCSTQCPYRINNYGCCFDGIPSKWNDLEKVFEKKDDGKEG